jgi:hypothetical protein
LAERERGEGVKLLARAWLGFGIHVRSPLVDKLRVFVIKDYPRAGYIQDTRAVVVAHDAEEAKLLSPSSGVAVEVPLEECEVLLIRDDQDED